MQFTPAIHFANCIIHIQWDLSIVDTGTQWNLSIVDTLGTEKQFIIQRLFYMCNNLSGPTKLVCYREVSAIKEVCCKRFHCMCPGCKEYMIIVEKS